MTKIKDSLEIAQVQENEKDKINMVIKENIPLVISNFINNNNLDLEVLNNNNTEITAFHLDSSNNPIIDNMTIQRAYQLYKTDKGGFREIIINGLLHKSLEDTFLQYKSPLSINTKTTINCLPLNYTSTLSKKYYNLNLFFIDQGSVTFQLYHPKYKQYLNKITHKSHKSPLVKNQETWETLKDISNQARYLEVIVRQGQAIIIPYQWIYSYKTLEKSIVVNFNSLDMMGPLIFSLDGYL